MGFLDKAKKMAEQAQAKLDEVQTQFNDGQGGAAAGGEPAVEYDKHGRPVPQHPPATATPPQGDPLAARTAPPPASPAATPGVPPTGQGDPLGAAAAAPAPPPPTAEPPVAQPGVPPTGSAPSAPPTTPPLPSPASDPAAPAAEAAAPGTADVPEDRNKANYEPPKLSSGDPLAG
jgi:hypothetical protein